MKKIDISTKTFPNKFTIVDDDNFEYLNQWKWHYDNGYAYRRQYFKDGKYKHIYMQYLVIGKGKIDHKNGNGLDNRKENLRFATHQQNMSNRRNNKLNGYKGVYFHNHGKRRKRWVASIQEKLKKIFLGRFFKPEEAAVAYNEAAKKYFGEFAYLNKIGRF